MAGVALFDADGTLHEGYVMFDVYQAFEDEGMIKPSQNEYLLEVLDKYDTGEIGFTRFLRSALLRGARILKGHRVSTADHIAKMYFNESNYKTFEYVEPTLRAVDNSAVDRMLITASPEFVASGIAKALEFKRYYSSNFGAEVVDGTKQFYDGTVIFTMMPDKKTEIARLAISTLENMRPGVSYAFGDSEGDIHILDAVDVPVCIKPRDILLRYAQKNGWLIIDNPDEAVDLFTDLSPKL